MQESPASKTTRQPDESRLVFTFRAQGKGISVVIRQGGPARKGGGFELKSTRVACVVKPTSGNITALSQQYQCKKTNRPVGPGRSGIN